MKGCDANDSNPCSSTIFNRRDTVHFIYVYVFHKERTMGMTTNEQIFDINHSVTTLLDDPFWDGTDEAHPAWFRGQEQATKVIAEQL